MKKTMAKKIIAIFIILVLLTSTSAFLYASSVIEDPVYITFQDSNLYNAVKLYFEAEGLKYSANEVELKITASQAELVLIEELNLKGTDTAKISNISGIESFVNLKEINLSNNNITDITPIASLANLISINLSNNTNINIYNNGTCYLPNQSNLEELYISSTNNNDISFVSNLPSLKVLNVSNNGISVLTPLATSTLDNIEVLDISNNGSITSIDDILSLYELKELNIASTGITDLLHSDYEEDKYERGIFNLTKLENLNVENNELSIEPVYKTYENSEGEDIIYLKELKKLNFNYTGQGDIDYESLAMLENLTHLYMKGNGIETVEDAIATLDKLEYIDLSDNNIEDISGFIKYGDEEVIEDTLSAKQINLEHNRIQDIRPLFSLGHDITFLDLSSNIIFYAIDVIDFGRFTFSEGLDLSRQGLDKEDEEGNPEYYYLDIKDKIVEVNQYIILPALFQNSKNSESVVYAENVTFSYENIELNPDTKYHVPGQYNVIIEPPDNEQDDEEYDEEITTQKVLSITLNGGCADGSTLRFQYTDDESAIDSILFEDENLNIAIANELKSRITSDNEDDYYVAEAQNILNVTNLLISETKTLDLGNKNISNLAGLSSFENLTNINLTQNNISSIDELRYCENMEQLNVSNNPNIGNNNSAIENMMALTKLDLSNTGITNIQSLQNLIAKWQEEEEFTLTELGLSNNAIGNIKNVGLIDTLQKLYISNIGIEDISEVKTLTKLQTLNASGNSIKNIDVLQNLTKLRYLDISTNQIQDITPISKISLNDLNIAYNKVKDVSSLTASYTTIVMDGNQISDISNFNGKLIETFSVTNQSLSESISEDETGTVTMPLPQIFKDAKDSTSKVYTQTAFVTTNCELSSDGNSAIINPTTLGDKIATVRIEGGNADDTTISFKIEKISSDQITSSDLTVVENELMVKGISPKTTVTSLKGMLASQMEYEIVDKNGTTISETSLVGTGCKIKMANDKTYTLIVLGDCNGDGKVTVREDMLLVNAHRLSGDKLTGEYLTAADVNENGEIKVDDMIMINAIRLKQNT